MDSVLVRSSTRSRVSDGEWLSIGLHETVLNSEGIYWEINKDLSRCGMKMERIDRIIHLELSDNLQTFNKELQIIGAKNPKFGANVQSLYTGVLPENLIAYCQEGLDHRSDANRKHSYFGNGIYFSESPERARIDAEKNKSSLYYLLLCKVILGDCKEYPDNEMDTELAREPEKEHKHPITGAIVYYDSVVGRPSGNYVEYVVYEKRRALVEYVIEYTCDKPLPDLPIVKIPNKSSNGSRRQKTRRAPSADSSSSGDVYNSDGEYQSHGSADENNDNSGSENRAGHPSVQCLQYAEGASMSTKVNAAPPVAGPKAAQRTASRPALKSSGTTPVAHIAISTSAVETTPIAAIPAEQKSAAEVTAAPTTASSASTAATAAPIDETLPAQAATTAMASKENLKSEDDDDNAAIMRVFDELVSEFTDFTGADSRVAKKFLIKYKFNMDAAVSNFWNK